MRARSRTPPGCRTISPAAPGSGTRRGARLSAGVRPHPSNVRRRARFPRPPLRYGATIVPLVDRFYPPLLAGVLRRPLERGAGAPYLATARWLREFYAWPAERRREWQDRRLDEIIRHIRRDVPFYAGCAAPDGNPRSALAALPVVDKVRIKHEPDAFHARGWKEMCTLAKTTSGSTGQPFAYVLDCRAWAHIYAAAINFRERVNVRYGERVVLLGAPTALGLEAPDSKRALRHRIERHDRSLTGFDIGRAASLERARQAGRRDAAMWYGYASTIAAMAQAVLSEGITTPGPRAIVTMAEVLQPAWREQIRQAFRAPVFDEYGSNDGGVLSQTCEHGRFHLAENVSIVEVLEDGAPCPPGVEGEVVVTNLHARALPFVRYRIGDRAVPATGACECGRSGPALEHVTGRSGETILLPDGSEISGHAFGMLFANTPGVERWQIFQSDPSSIRIRLDVGEPLDDGRRDAIQGFARRHCGPDVAVHIVTDEPLDRTTGGKLRMVVRGFG
jgi:phenylacetate-CoA ligase